MRASVIYRTVGIGGVTLTAVAGLVAWLALMASAPRYSYGAHEDLGHGNLLLLVLACIALTGALALPRLWRRLGAAAVLPSLLLSPWTAPRGDDDGLWLLIVPVLAVWIAVCIGVAYLAMRVRAVVARRAAR